MQREPSTRDRVKEMLRLLEGEYGVRPWKLEKEPVAVLVRTILSQNTSDTNSHRAFRSLVECFPGWEDIARADPEAIARCIDRGGLGRIKAQRIKDSLSEIMRRQGRLELDFLRCFGIPDALAWLESLPGVGEKTSRCVLLFSLGLPALPVDTHIWRVSRRVGLIRSNASIAEAHRVLADLVAPEDIYRFHVLTIEHGRKVCRARNPSCPSCVINSMCLTFLATGHTDKALAPVIAKKAPLPAESTGV